MNISTFNTKREFAFFMLVKNNTITFALYIRVLNGKYANTHCYPIYK